MIISVRRTTTMIISNRQTITIKISIRKTTAMKISDGIASLKRCGHEKSECHYFSKNSVTVPEYQ